MEYTHYTLKPVNDGREEITVKDTLVTDRLQLPAAGSSGLTGDLITHNYSFYLLFFLNILEHIELIPGRYPYLDGPVSLDG